MAKIKFTISGIKKLLPGDKDAYYWDEELDRFGLKITPKGRKVFFIQYRTGGRGSPSRKVTLGVFGTITLAAARNEAKKLLANVTHGRDPAAERQLEKQQASTDKVRDLVDLYVLRQVIDKRPSTQREIKRVLQQELVAKHGNRSIREITKPEIIAILERKVDQGSRIMANRTLAYIRTFFNWCVARGIIDQSPCAGVQAQAKERSRERFLDDDELAAVMLAAREMGGAFGGIVEMLTLTAQRRSEVAEMRWDEVDPDAGIWTIPAARSKNDKAHTVHLCSRVRAVIESQPQRGPLVFTTTGDKPFQGFSKAKRELDERSGVTDWTLHDLRRTVVTGLAKLGTQPHIADKLLNHQSGTISGVAAVYQLHEFLDERKVAIDTWAQHVQQLLDDAPNEGLVPLR